MKLDIDAQAGSPSAVPRARVNTYPGNPERLAWLVILGAFLACILLGITLPLSGYNFVLFSMEGRTSTLEAINPIPNRCSTVSLFPFNAQQPVAVTCDNPISFSEGSTVKTDSASEAFVTFFDGSTAQVLTNSSFTIQQMEAPRFPWSQLPNAIVINQDNGEVRYGVARAVAHSGNPEGRAMHLVVHTSAFEVTLNEGSYSIETYDNAPPQVIVREGLAVVRSLDGSRTVAVGEGQRLQVAQSQELPDPVPAAQNLIQNGDFSPFKCPPDDLTYWTCFFDQGGDAGTVNGALQVVTVDGRSGLQIKRSGAGTNSAITGVRQMINRDVSSYRSLVFSADLRLHSQSLSGGGYLSTEYPLILRLYYRDVNGDEFDAVRGLYYQNNDNNPTKNGEQVPRDQWIPYQTGNLLTAIDPQPFYLLYVELYASGWDYESYISGVRLTAE